MTRALLFLAAFLPAVAAADESIRAGVKLGYEEIEAWDVAAARKIADELAARAPDDPEVQELLAHVRFEEGDFASAARIIDSLDSPKSAWFAQLVRDTYKETQGYASRESEHFVFYYPEGKDAVLPPYGLEILEKQRAALEKTLGWVPPGRTRIDVVDDAKALAKLSTLTVEAIKTSGTIAICKFNRLIITSPKAMVRGYEWLDTLAHEYNHLVISKMSRNRVPIWVHEGLAKYLESGWRGQAGLALEPSSAALLAEALKKDSLIPFERMHPSMALLPSQEDAALAFAEVFTAIEFMHKRGGNPLLVAIIENLKSGDRYEAAISKALGMPFGRFHSEWMAYLARREFPRETIPHSIANLKFKEDVRPESPKDKKDEEIRFGDFLEIEDAQGRKFAHLGELLRIRNRQKAAIEEFNKAYTRVGNRSPALSNRYAQALIKTGDLARAEQLLVASLKPFPGHPKTLQNLGDIYMATQRWGDAERAFLGVVGVDPFDPLPHMALAKIYSERKDDRLASREKVALQILSGKAKDAPTTGTVIVRSRPLARVFLDGADTGKTTPSWLQVPPGSHVVRLVNDERGFTHEAAVEIEAGEEKTIDFNADADADAHKP